MTVLQVLFDRNKLPALEREWQFKSEASGQPSFLEESQNHRMVGVGRDLCGSSSLTLLPKQGHLQS